MTRRQIVNALLILAILTAIAGAALTERSSAYGATATPSVCIPPPYWRYPLACWHPPGGPGGDSNYDGGLTDGGGQLLYCLNSGNVGQLGSDGYYHYRCQSEQHHAINAYWTASGWKWGCPDLRNPCFHWHWIS
jgi:hypothetical protein